MRKLTYEEFRELLWPEFCETGETEDDCVIAYGWYLRGRESVRW